MAFRKEHHPHKSTAATSRVDELLASPDIAIDEAMRVFEPILDPSIAVHNPNNFNEAGGEESATEWTDASHTRIGKAVLNLSFVSNIFQPSNEKPNRFLAQLTGREIEQVRIKVYPRDTDFSREVELKIKQTGMSSKEIKESFLKSGIAILFHDREENEIMRRFTREIGRIEDYSRKRRAMQKRRKRGFLEFR